MLKQSTVVLPALLAIFAGLMVFASPATAAQEGDVGPWEMPDLVEQTLQRAENSLADVTNGFALNLDIRTKRGPQEIMNYTNWEVCYQWPSAGSEISAKAKRVILYVRRPHTSGC